MLEGLFDGGAEGGGTGEFVAVAEDGAQIFAEDAAFENFGAVEFGRNGVVLESLVEPGADFFVFRGVGDKRRMVPYPIPCL